MCAAPMGMMAVGGQRAGGDALAAWAEGLAGRRGGVRGRGRLRFAFYGRVSTEDWQDPVTSRARQLAQAVMLVAGRGVVVAEFFDTGQSRVLAWPRRPQAAALVAALADPDRGWDAVVIGEYERAFYGSQYASMAPLFEHYGVSLWTPEVGGRVDWHAEDHEQTMLALGLSSKREITRTRIRVRTAMAAQTLEQGRYLGGRPPYGYRLADAGPHPNKAHAAWGRRAHKLEPDSETAPVVAWMFAQRLAGHSAARITRALNDAGVPCPSAADPGRNPHRTGAAWTLRTVAAILANPRYTGRQVWNRQRTDFDLVDPVNTSLGHRQVQRWNLPEGWVISKRPAHAALVSEADFIKAQDTAAPRGPAAPCCRSFTMSVVASFLVSVAGVRKPRRAAAGRGFALRVSRGCSVCRHDLGDGGAGGCLVDEVLAGGAGGDEGGGGEVVDGAGFPAGGLVDLGDGVFGEEVGGAAGDLEVVADVAGGLAGGHAFHLVSDGDALVECR
jgi:site-specific DNA recombinase